ncbi:kinase-like protein, partial [Glonium stellatum]
MNVGTGELITSKRVEEPWILSQAGELIPVFKDLHHENIVSYLGYELNGSIGWFFFEYIPGGTVAECLRKYGRLSEPVIRHIVKQTLFGLAYLHERSLCHGDLTADSIMLDSDSVCKIDMSLLSASQYSLGISMISDDIWRLGFTAVEMFSGRQLGDFMRRPLAKAPPIPKDVSAVISPEGASFIHDCFTVDPLDRPSAKDLLSHPFSHLDKNFNFFDTETFPQMR